MNRKTLASLARDAWSVPQLAFWGALHMIAAAVYVCVDTVAMWPRECPDCAELRANGEFVQCESCQHNGVL